MKLRGITLGLGAITLAIAMSSCAKGPLATGKEDDGGSSGDDAGTTTVTMSGTLALASPEEEAAALVQEAYNLYCVTFTEVPSACKIDVGGEGSFSKECGEFANKAFGCFLRQGNTTLASIEFDLGSALTVGGGALVFAVNYDPETGLAYAKIDSALSTALGTAVGGGEATVMDLNGNWKIGCATGGDAEIGDCAGQLPPDGFTMNFSTFDLGDSKKLAMWASSERRDVCLAGGTEALPNFRIAFNGKETKFDYTSKETFEASVEALYATLPAEVQTQIVSYSKARGNHDFCSNQPTADDCKLIEPEMEEVMVPDPNAPNGMRKEHHPKPIESFDSLAEYTGAATASQWKCALKPELQGDGIPPCGGNMPDPDGDGFGGGTNYMSSNNKPLMLVCKVGDTDIRQFPVMAATKADSIKAAMSGGGSDCGKVTFAGKSYLRAQVEEIRRATYELFRVEGGGPNDASSDPSKMCERSEVPDDFKFSSCTEGSDKEVCWLKNNLSMYGLKISGAKLASSGSQPNFDHRAGSILCPSVKLGNDHMKYMSDCRNAVAGMGTLVEQLRALMKMQALHRPMSEAIICGRSADDALRTKLLDAIKNSCVAEVDYDKRCFEGGVCETTMACRGSSNNGKCLSDDGSLFSGRINGRDELMDLKMMVGGAFSMSSSSLEKYYRFDQESNKPVACTFAKQFVINARKVDDNTFNGVVSQAGKQSCDGKDSEGASLALQDGGPGPGPGPGGDGGPGGGDGGPGGGDGGGDGGDGGGDEGGPFSLPITATRQ
jgi:hypothetical protein